MKVSGISISWLLLSGALVATGTFVLPRTGQSADSTTSSSAKPTSTHQHKGERHPEIHKAIKKLEAAKDDLQHAAHDFGGHRVKALQAVDQALQELHLALEFDKQ